ncbi:hypothetical protein SAMN05216388_103150 [Halorientalis persicus]|uniref:DUF8129 domain-containing protein n=1 Tax=Halorientalis persicus TaxID=1367881 RepID=A0A1H8UX39_9EURY|nr:hypothetical protein [Halorientalis persicus]SEP07790.1 hypothetical protein SAMN05216388_103150 [Halorientalis persicus]
MTPTESGDSAPNPVKYLDTPDPDLIRARILLLDSLNEIEAFLAAEVDASGRPGVLTMLRRRAEMVTDDQEAVEDLFETYENRLAELQADPRPPKDEMVLYLVVTAEDTREVDSENAPEEADIIYVDISGSKIELDSPYETKEDIKAMETSEREWTGSYWAVSQSYAQQSIEHLTSAGYTLAIHRDVRDGLQDPLSYDS